ncbi:Ig-like domain repeat protein [Edaphobacter sp.]|uniref:NHL domain-containing protein n=1 Tax=Edaphobacter sp. TaxID=1934404 RepID=UPI002DB84858|nr:Ig-like domain repeat protein [Edaphobacter sp.]HEU5341733.1 Ig-like domain repeat protein [Edaphobacter sp.]
MGLLSNTPTRLLPRHLSGIAFALLFALCARAQTPATSVPLVLPSAIAYDAQGNLYIAEAGKHDIRKVDSAGDITTIAGTGTQGFGGDGGSATAAELDSPQGLAVDAAGDLYVADTHNQRIRKIAATTGIITTVAGAGVAGYSGDGGPAVSARLDLPTAIALDTAGNLYVADTANHRIRKISVATGIITTAAGNGVEGYSGDGAAATAAALDSPAGLAVDTAGNVYLADTHNDRIRRIDAATGIITTIAGSGAFGYSGDNAAATGAKLALPHGITLDAAGNVYIVDTRNQRIRRIDAATGQITAVAGTGRQDFSGDNAPATTASLDSPRAVATSPAGFVTLADTANQRVRQLSSANPAIIHTIAGLGTVQTVDALTLSAPAASTYGSGHIAVSLNSGTAATGSVTFVDTFNGVASTLGTAPLAANTATLSAAALDAGTHSITASYAGDATHAPQTATFTLLISKAAATVAVSISAANVVTGQPVTITATLAAGAGQPSGTITLFDGTTQLDTIQVPATGQVAFTTAALGAGSHSVTAVYSGDGNFTSAASAPATIGIGSPVVGDFAIAANGAASQTVAQGNSASFSFGVQWQGTPLSGPIMLSAAGLPPMAKASFSPAYLPPGASSSVFTLTVSTAGTTASRRTASPFALALLLLPIGFTLRGRRKLTAIFAAIFLVAALLPCTGCGDRINTAGLGTSSATPYTITVTGTATTPSGTTVAHSATVTLVVQKTS